MAELFKTLYRSDASRFNGEGRNLALLSSTQHVLYTIHAK